MYTNLQVFVGPDREIRGRDAQPGLNGRVIYLRNTQKHQNIFKAGPQSCAFYHPTVQRLPCKGYFTELHHPGGKV